MVVIKGTLGLIEWLSKSPGTEYRVINTAHDLTGFIRDSRESLPQYRDLEIFEELIKYLGKLIVGIYTDVPVYKESIAG